MNDFSKGKVWKNIVAQAVPLTLAQMVQLLYNIVDRIYIGHLDGEHSMALTGVGLAFPIITFIMAFTALYGMGGATLFAIARGAKEDEKAEQILGNVFCLLIVTSGILMAVCYLFRRPILFLFGASEVSYVYAEQYLNIYLMGTPFAMISVGLNRFVNAEGFPKTGMLTTMIGAMLNLLLDPVFIYGMKMGVQGAALATVIGQIVSAIWVLRFLIGRHALQKLRKRFIRIEWKRTMSILSLGAAGFIMYGTNCLVQIVCNAVLQEHGGDLYVGIMTVLYSVREILELPISGIMQGSQPVMGYNFGAEKRERVKAAIRFNTWISILYTLFAWGMIMLIPQVFFRIFSNDSQMIVQGTKALNIYFFGFVFMSFQYSGQAVFQALRYAKHAMFFSMLRKAFIVAPLTVILPNIGFGVYGVFMAEPISNVIGGLSAFICMRRTVYKNL